MHRTGNVVIDMEEQTKHLLLVDDNAEQVSAVINFCARSQWPYVEVETYDPTLGVPKADFNWGDFDLLLLDLNVGRKHHNGLEWLRLMQQSAALPTTIILAEVVTAAIRNDAATAGAKAVIDKLELSPRKFREIASLIGPTERGVTDKRSSDSGAPDLDQTLVNPSDISSRLQRVAASETKHDGLSDDTPIPGYRLLKKMRGSGIAQIFVAEQLGGENNIVVLKALRLNDGISDAMQRRFTREYRYIESINHPSVVNVFETGLTDEFAYIAMEYCPHGTLVDLIDQGITAEDTISFVKQIAAGLGAVHLHGISHRDIKPANCLLRTPKRVVLADFGIAKDERTMQALTSDDDFFGTLFYTSPEQLKGAEGDARGDLYSLGIMMYQMLSGSLDVRACLGVPPVVLHLSLENIREEPPELLVSILSTIYLSKPSIICMLSYLKNSVAAEFC